MPTCVQVIGDVVSIHVDRAGAEETIAVVALERGRLDRAVLALRAAQRQLADAELEVLRRIREANLRKVQRG